MITRYHYVILLVRAEYLSTRLTGVSKLDLSNIFGLNYLHRIFSFGEIFITYKFTIPNEMRRKKY